MAASTQQKLDYLLKKIGYTASKTGLAEDSSLSGTKKAPFAESIPSPLVTANSSIWTDSDSIPGTPPGSDSSYVKVYLASASGHRMTVDSTVSGSRAFIAYSTYNNTSTAILGDWIDTQFGDSYIIKVYKGDPNSGGTLLSAAGSGSNDTWFFDYASGVLNFNGTVIPSGVTDTNIYIVGYRYIGAKGTATAGINTSGTSKFTNLNVSGVTTVGFATATDVWVSGAITATTFDGNLATTNLTGTITNAQLAGSIANDKLANSTVSYGGISLALGGTDATPAFNLTDATNYPYTSLTGITTDIVGDTTPQLGGNLDGNSKSIYGVGIITATTLDISGNVDIDGTTELDDVNVSAASTFGGLVDINAGAQANTLKVEDLTDNRLVIAGTGGELEDSSKVTFDGSTFAIVGDATFSGNVTIGGTLTKEDVTNIDSVGLVTAQSGVRITAGGLVISSGVATFTDAIDANGGLDVTGGSGLVASTAKISDLTSGRVVVAGTSGELEDASTLTFSGGTLSATTFSGSGASLNSIPNGALDNSTVSYGGISLALGGTDATPAFDLTDATNYPYTSLTGITTDIVGDTTPTLGGNLDGNSKSIFGVGIITATSFSGTLLTAAQTNITSVGTLTSLDVSGNITGAGDLTLTDTTADSAAGPELKLFRNSASPADADYLGQIKFAGESDTGVERNYAKITGKILDASNGTEDGIIEFAHIKAGSQTITGRFRSDSLQLLNDTALSVAGDITANGNIAGDGSTNITGINAITAAGDITANGNVVGDNSTNISGINSVTATKYYGDGSAITGISTGTWGVTTGAQGTGNLYAGTLAGENSDTDTCYNIGVGYKSACTLNEGDHNVFLGSYSGECATNGACNVAIGYSAAKCSYNNSAQIFIGRGAGANASSTGGLCSNSIAIGSCAGHCKSHYDVFIGYHAGCSNVDGQYNIFAGSQVGTAVTDGCSNIMLGKLSGRCMTTGDNNVFIGKQAAQCITCSDSNIIIGDGAVQGYPQNIGDSNIIMGVGAGVSLGATARCNVVLGTYAGYCLSAGCDNIALGQGAGYEISGGSYNTFLGHYSGCTTTTGSDNIAIGKRVKLPSATGNNQFAIGCCSCHWITGNANWNVGIGTTNPDIAVGVGNTAKLSVGILSAYQLYGDGQYLTNVGGASTDAWAQDSQGNLFAGTAAGAARDADTCFNIGIGQSAGKALNEGDGNVLLGCYAGSSLTSGSQNIAIGNRAGASWQTAGSSVAIGFEAGFDGGSGDVGNVLIGCRAGYEQHSSNNVAIGKCASYAAHYGAGSVSIGAYAGRDNGSAENVFVGCGAGMCNKRQFITFLGSQAGACANCAGSSTFVGTYAGQGKGATSTGCYNTFIGNRTGRCFTTAASNTFLGQCAGCIITTGSYNTFLGNSVGEDTATGSCNVAIGHSVSLPILNGDHQLAIGSGSNYWITGNSNWNVGIGTTNPDIAVGAGNTAKLSVGIVSAYQLYGDGTNLTGVGGGTLISGFTVKEESSTVGTAGSITILDFQGASVTASASGANTAVITVAAGGGSTDGWIQDSQANLVAGTNAGASFNGNTSCNVLIGQNAGRMLTAASGSYSADSNVMIGVGAGQSAVTTYRSILIGEDAGKCGTSNFNIAVGFGALKEGGGSYKNIVIGYNAGSLSNTKMTATNMRENVLLGYNAAFCGVGQKNVMLGNYVGYGATMSCENIFIGEQAGYGAVSLTGRSNIAIGPRAGCSLAAAHNTVLMGCNAGRKLTNGSSNVFIGNYAGSEVTTAADNTFVGGLAGKYNQTGTYNAAFGYRALFGNATPANNTGGYNVAVGAWAGVYVASGTRNSLIGYRAGDNITSGCCNVIIGAHVDPPSATGNCQFAIGANTCHWITGNSNFNVGIGTTNPDIAVGVGNTAKLSVGIVSAYQLYGDGQYLTGISAGFSQDSQGNLVAGDGAGAAKDADTCFNIMLGCKSGEALNEGDHNILLGCVSGCKITSGSYNIILGREGGKCLTVGGGNVYIGDEAGSRNETGYSNTFIGNKAGNNVATDSASNTFVGDYAGNCVRGGCNTAVGKRASWKMCNGSYNVAMGDCALHGSATHSDNTGGCNVAIGKDAGKTVSSGSANIALGMNAMSSDVVTGSSNVAIGRCAGRTISSGASNFFGGYCAGELSTCAKCNVFVGHAAGTCRQSGCYNIAFGKFALRGTSTPSNNSGSNNIGIGHSTGLNVKGGSRNIAIGCAAMGDGTVTGNDNTAIGCYAGYSITSGTNNILFGKNAGDALTSGSNVVAIGVDALTTEDTLSGSVAIGYEALKLQNNGNGNTAIGCQAGAAVVTGGENVFLGWSAGANMTGSTNTIIGALAMSSASSGASNVAIGQDAGRNNTGDNNVIIGATAGDAAGAGEQNVFVGRNAGSAVTDGQQNTFLGMNAGNSTTTGNGNVMIGSGVCLANGNCSFAIGHATNYWIQGDSSYNTTVNDISASNFNSTSDIRLKTNIQPIGDPIGKVKQIEGVSFNWKKDNKPALGVIADQVEKILPELVHGDDPKTVNYNGLIGLLIEAVKEQQIQIDELKSKLP